MYIDTETESEFIIIDQISCIYWNKSPIDPYLNPAPYEKKAEKKVTEYATKIGYQEKKDGMDGWPDRIYINPNGYHIYIEFKRKDKGLSEKQKEVIKKLRERNCKVFVIDNYEAGRWILDSYLDR
jgi:hypothetical protein